MKSIASGGAGAAYSARTADCIRNMAFVVLLIRSVRAGSTPHPCEWDEDVCALPASKSKMERI